MKENNKIAFVNPKDKIQVEKTDSIKSVYFNTKTLKFLGMNPFVQISYRGKTIQSNLIGKYNYNNIAVAITIGEYFKLSLQQIKEGIESYIPKNNRSQIIEKSSNKIILDAYNANPSSMEVALQNFASLPNKNKVIILGDMFELGKDSFKEHQAIVDLSKRLNFENLFFIGEHFFKTQTNKNKFKTYTDFEVFIKKEPLKNKSILIKGSRGMRLERLLEIIN